MQYGVERILTLGCLYLAPFLDIYVIFLLVHGRKGNHKKINIAKR